MYYTAGSATATVNDACRQVILGQNSNLTKNSRRMFPYIPHSSFWSLVTRVRTWQQLAPRPVRSDHPPATAALFETQYGASSGQSSHPLQGSRTAAPDARSPQECLRLHRMCAGLPERHCSDRLGPVFLECRLYSRTEPLDEVFISCACSLFSSLLTARSQHLGSQMQKVDFLSSFGCVANGDAPPYLQSTMSSYP